MTFKVMVLRGVNRQSDMGLIHCIFLLYLLPGIYEIFCGNKNFYVGKQPDPFPGTTGTVCIIVCVFTKLSFCVFFWS